MRSVALSPDQRSQTLATLRGGGGPGGGGRELDVLVVGGGVVGAGAALDAVTRGLSVALVEARDWASGTSSRSSKLVHGGLRYLERFDFALVREALRERGLLLQKLAPHLVHPVPFLYPLKHRVWERAYVTAGVTLYDTMGISSGNARGVPHHRQLTMSRIRQLAPGLRPDSLVGAVQYYDGQVDDARHTMAVVRTAVDYGALALNHCQVQDYLRTDGDSPRVIGARVRDLASGESFELRAQSVINATGVWTDDLQALAGTTGDFKVQASKGVHLVVPRERIDLHTGLILQTEKSVLFVIPWGRHWIIGTTDTAWDLDKADPAISAGDVDYLLEHVNSVLVDPISHDDIESVYAGLRPLVAGASKETSRLSREHVVGSPVPGLTVVAGGKYTTYRVMGADAVDVAVTGLDRQVPASCTAQVPLSGADGYIAVRNARYRLIADSGLPGEQIDRLLGRYGSLTGQVLELIADDRSLAQTLPGTLDYLGAEVVYAATAEGAMSVEDVLVRRTRLWIESRDRGAAAADVVARLLAPVLGWDSERETTEVESYRAQVAAERAAQTQPDDQTANAARTDVATQPPLTARRGSHADGQTAAEPDTRAGERSVVSGTSSEPVPAAHRNTAG